MCDCLYVMRDMECPITSNPNDPMCRNLQDELLQIIFSPVRLNVHVPATVASGLD